MLCGVVGLWYLIKKVSLKINHRLTGNKIQKFEDLTDHFLVVE